MPRPYSSEASTLSGFRDGHASDTQFCMSPRLPGRPEGEVICTSNPSLPNSASAKTKVQIKKPQPLVLWTEQDKRGITRFSGYLQQEFCGSQYPHIREQLQIPRAAAALRKAQPVLLQCNEPLSCVVELDFLTT